MLKAVKTFEYCSASRYTGYIPKSIHLTLECGHDQFRKASRGVPKRANCKECDRAAVREPEGCNLCDDPACDGNHPG